MFSKEKHSNRRKFIGDISCAGVGSTAALSSLLNLKLAGSLAAADGQAETDYRALVCVFLGGGNDSFNMLAPYSGDQRLIYEETRGEIGYPLEDFSSLSGHGPGDTELGLHKNMPNLKALYESGKASFISNVGTLIEPATVAGIQANTVKLPLGLFSHSDQSLHWQSGMPETRNPGSGWGGRMADMLDDLNEVSRISMNISMAGINLYQSGVQTSVLSKAPGTMPSIKDWNHPDYLPRRKVTSDMMEAQYQSIFERAFAAQMKEVIGASEDYRSALESTAPLEAIFTTDNSLSMQLKDVAEGIAAHDNLGKCRQTFFVMAGGWDHHASLDPHPDMLAMLDKAIGEFQKAITELGLVDQVTLFSASEFGRTITPNGGGSDHGWGGNQFVVGGAVNGGGTYGEYPDLAVESPLHMTRGRMIPTTSVDEYFAELALWMGVARSDLGEVLPNLHRFWDQSGGGHPLGFMSEG